MGVITPGGAVGRTAALVHLHGPEYAAAACSQLFCKVRKELFEVRKEVFERVHFPTSFFSLFTAAAGKCS